MIETPKRAMRSRSGVHRSIGHRPHRLLTVGTLLGVMTPAVAAAQDGGQAAAGDATVLGPIVVTSTATEHQTLTSPSFTTVITREQIEDAPPANGLPDLLRDYVGIDNSADNLGRDEVVIRGLGSEYTLVLVNGKRVSSSNALWRGGDFDYNSIPLASIEQVEIVRGPMSALYGSDAIGGVVNIITRKPGKEWTGNVGAEYRFVQGGDKGDQYRLNGYASGPLVDGLSANISAEWYSRDAWYTNTKDNGDVPALEEKEIKNLRAGLSWDVTDVQTVDGYYALNKDDRPYAIYDTDPSYREQEITRHSVGLSHTGHWSWGSTLLEGNYEKGDIDDFNTTYDAPQQRNLTEENTFLHARATLPFDIHLLTGGLEYRSQEVGDDVSYAQTGTFELTQKAAYLQDEIELTDKLSLTIGGRYDDHEYFGGHATGRANVVYRVTNDISLKGGVSEAFKAPDAYQLSPQYSIISCGGGCFLEGNPDLEPETSISTEIGVEIQKRTWDLSVAAFQNDVEDMIVAEYDPVANDRDWVNKNSVKLKGVEVSGSVDLLPVLTLGGNYAYLYTRDNTGSELDNRPRHSGNATLTWKFMEDYTATAAAHYTGRQWEGNTKLPAYKTFDIGATANLMDSLRIKAGVQNLTNVILTKKNEDFLQHELGRNYYLTATYSF